MNIRAYVALGVGGALIGAATASNVGFFLAVVGEILLVMGAVDMATRVVRRRRVDDALAPYSQGPSRGTHYITADPAPYVGGTVDAKGGAFRSTHEGFEGELFEGDGATATPEPSRWHRL